MNRLPDELKHPSGGERLQGTATDAVRLAHRALERFPELVKRHKFIAGGAAVSSSLVVLAGVAIGRRLRSGQSEEEAIASLTEEELAGRRVELPGDGPAASDDSGATEAAADVEVLEVEAGAEPEPPTNGAVPEDVEGVEEDGPVPAERGL